jgi:integrase
MKAEKPHRIPLSKPALAVLKLAADHGRGEEPWVFPGGERGQPLSNMAFLMLLRRMGRTDITAHGFRSTFRDWAAETTHFPNHVVEMARAHSIGNAVEAAYRRGDLLDKRRELMEDWAAFCGGV